MENARIREFVINEAIQAVLRSKGLERVSAVDAAKWLDRAGILKDSASRPGLPLRNLLRDDKIVGAVREDNSRWFIERLESPKRR